MLEEFYTGTFQPMGPVVEWDGTNHEEILAWVMEVSDYPTVIEHVSENCLILDLPTVHGYKVKIRRGGWIMRGKSGPKKVPLPETRWKTPDPMGRPVWMLELGS